MILFHGTGNYNLDSFLKEGIRLYVRHDHNRPVFCTSLSFKEAAFFALRKTPIDDKEFKNCGVVLEFELSKKANEGIDYALYKDCRAIRDEKEVVIYSKKSVKLVAVHKFVNDSWERLVIAFTSTGLVKRFARNLASRLNQAKNIIRSPESLRTPF